MEFGINRFKRVGSISPCLSWRYLLSILVNIIGYAIGSRAGVWRRLGGIGLGLLFLGLLPARQAVGQAGTAPDGMAPADVSILVIPISSTTADVALDYRTRVPFARVRKEVERLMQGTGWQIGKLRIEDGSLHPDNLKKFPKTTAAEFLLQQAPQLAEGAPTLQPYLRAFQSWNHLEVMFRMPAQTAAPSQDFENKAMHIRLIKDEGIYRYEVDISDHTGLMPSLTEPVQQAPSAAPPAPAEPAARPTGGYSVLALLLIAAGIGLAACAGVWLLLSRRTISGVSARTFRQ